MSLSRLPGAMTVEQAADFLRLSTQQIAEAIGSGELAVVRVDGIDLVDTAKLLSDLGIDGRLARQAGSHARQPKVEG